MHAGSTIGAAHTHPLLCPCLCRRTTTIVAPLLPALQVNKRYRLLEIEMDGVFKCMLLLKKKK